MSNYWFNIFCRGAPDTLDERDCGMESDEDENNGSLQGSQSKGTSKEGAEEGDSKVILDVLDDDLIQDFDDDEWTMLGNKRCWVWSYHNGMKGSKKS